MVATFGTWERDECEVLRASGEMPAACAASFEAHHTDLTVLRPRRPKAIGLTSPPKVYRFYKLSWLSGMLFVLPVVLGAAWYAWAAYAALDRYARAEDGGKEFNRTLYQVALHDELLRDLRRMNLPARPEGGRLPTYELYLGGESVDKLTRAQGKEEESSYVHGRLKKGSETRDVAVRQRGAAHWNWIGAQKSLKFRLDKGALLDDTRLFNLLNEPTAFGFEAEIILGIARERPEQLLVPEYYPVWLRLNNSDMGVYRYEAQPDEGLLRRNRRMPGSMFSGDSEVIDGARGVGSLFYDRKGWTKVAWKDDSQKDDYRELDRLLQEIAKGSYREFAEYAATSLNLDKYALFDALDVVFGCDAHDYKSNHKLYVDPYTGRIEPIAWSYRAFHHEPAFNLAENPLLLRLLLTPGYAAKRDHIVHQLLTGPASVPAVRDRTAKLFETLRPELEADPYWDAYKLLPAVSRFARYMVRPMNAEKWLLAAEDDLDDLARRSRFLLDELEADRLQAHWQFTEDRQGYIELNVSGHGAYRLDGVSVSAGECAGTFGVHADVDLNGRLDKAQDREVARAELGAAAHLATYRDLLSGVALEARIPGGPVRGKVKSTMQARRYGYFVSSAECQPSYVAISLHSLITGGSSRLTLPLNAGGNAERVPAPLLNAAAVPKLEPGDASPHPFSLPPEPIPERIELGPEPVVIDTSRTFSENQTVHIAPGTEVLLGEGVSLFFYGKVLAEGTLTKPIVFRPKDAQKRFGGIALQGSGASGSRLSNVEVSGGSRPQNPHIDYTALLNLHSTHDIELESMRLTGALGTEDVLHANSVTNLRLHELTIRNAPIDALDLEFADAEVRGLVVVGAGDDCVDLMGSRVDLTDSVLIACTHNAISAGEETDISAHNALMANSGTGLLSKNASVARLSRSLVYRTQVALQVHRKELHYSGTSSIRADELFAVGCQRLSDNPKGGELNVDQFQTTLPANGELPHLAQVLRLSDWAQLDLYITRLSTGEAP